MISTIFKKVFANVHAYREAAKSKALDREPIFGGGCVLTLLPLKDSPRVRKGGDAARYFCIIGAVICWLLLLILTHIWLAAISSP